MKKLCLLLLTLVSAHATAEKMYVSELQYQPMYSLADVRGELRMYLPSGTQVQVLESSGRFRHVKTTEGVTGWVSAGSLIDTKPYRLVAKEMTTLVQRQKVQIKSLSEQHQTSVEQMSTKIAELNKRLRTTQSKSKQAAIEADQKIKALSQAAAKPVTSVAAATSAVFTTRPPAAETAEPPAVPALDVDDKASNCPEVAEPPKCETVEAASAAQASKQGGGPSGIQQLFNPWSLGFAGGLFVLGVILGWFLNDWRVRRRHGGFRL